MHLISSFIFVIYLLYSYLVDIVVHILVTLVTAHQLMSVLKRLPSDVPVNDLKRYLYINLNFINAIVIVRI